MVPQWSVFLLIGFLGVGHCFGMCGPLVMMYSRRMESPDAGRGFELRQHLLFNLGRAATYALIGGVLGALGSVVYRASGVLTFADGLRGAVGVTVGAVILVVGLQNLWNASGQFPFLPGAGRVFGSLFDRVKRSLDRWVNGPRIGLLGSVHAFLPCPVLYPAFLFALAGGSVMQGAVNLGALGLGTVPAMVVYGVVFRSVGSSTSPHLHRVLGVAYLVLGVLSLSMGLKAWGWDVPHLMIPFYQPLSPPHHVSM